MKAINFLTTISNHLPYQAGRPGGTYKNVLNTLEPKRNGRHFADDISKLIFLYENHGIVMQISVKSVPRAPY